MKQRAQSTSATLNNLTGRGKYKFPNAKRDNKRQYPRGYETKEATSCGR